MRVVRALAAGALALAAVAVVAPAGAGPPEFGIERTWRPFPDGSNAQNVRLLVDESARVLYVVSQDVNHSGPLVARAWDIDTLAPRSTPYTEPVLGVSTATPAAVDEAHHALLVAPLPYRAQIDAQTTLDHLASVPAVSVLGMRGTAMVRFASVPTRFPAGYALLGLAVDAAHDRAYAVAEPSGTGAAQYAGAGAGGVQVDVWKLGAFVAGRVESDLAAPLAVPVACGQVLATYSPAGLLPSRDGKSVFFGCLSNRKFAALTGPSVADSGGVARLDLTGTFHLATVNGNFSDGDSYALPGVQRLMFAANNPSATTYKVYDAAHGYYVGDVGLDAIGQYAVGIDQRGGRVYYVSGEGLGTFDTRVTPVTQGLVYDEFKPILGTLHRDIAVDSVTRRVFIPTADNILDGARPFAVVFRDRGPLPVPDEEADDGDDVAEAPGVTDSTRAADAGALGAELRVVGGPNALVLNATHEDTRGAIKPGTRWEQFAAARGIGLTGDEATAEVVTTRQDTPTTGDLNGTSFAAPIQCADLGYSPQTVTADSAQVTCDVGKQEASADVAAEGPRILLTNASQKGLPVVPAPIQVRSAAADVTLVRDGTGPLTATLRAEADGIDLLGVVQIGRVVATVTTTSQGRPGTASTTYVRSISGVVVNGREYCATNCSLDQVAALVNTALDGRARISFPEPMRYVSRKGTVARVRDNDYRHVERTQFDDLPAEDYLVPALEVFAYVGGTAPSRLEARFAAISANTEYRIFRIGGYPPSRVPQPAVVQQPLPRTDAVAPPAAGPQHVTVIRHPVTPRAGVQNPVQSIRDGLRVVFRSPGRVAAVAAVWALLALPVYLAARRRLLVDLPYLRRGEPS